MAGVGGFARRNGVPCDLWQFCLRLSFHLGGAAVVVSSLIGTIVSIRIYITRGFLSAGRVSPCTLLLIGSKSTMLLIGSLASCGFRGVFGCGGIFSCFFLRTHTTCCKYEAVSCLIYLSTSNEENSERSEGVSPLSNGRLCADASEKIPRTFANNVPLFNLIVHSSLVCVH